MCCHSFACGNAIDYAKFYSRSHDAVIRVYDDAGDVTEAQEHAGDFKEWSSFEATTAKVAFHLELETL
jgi:hypothetical protein